MNSENDTITAEAAAWHAASGHDNMDWDGFTIWLEADPRHRTAYDEVARADSLLDDHRDALLGAIGDAEPEEPVAARPVFGSWKRWAAVAIAASLVAVMALPRFLESPAATYDTGATAQRIALNDGSSVTLAPHSRLIVEGGKQQHMALNGGAWFNIRHNPSRPLEITAGQVQISDIGTKFDIQATGRQVRVEVADGTVEVASQALSQPIRLSRNRSLLYDGKDGTALVTPIDHGDIGEWRLGRLSYESTPLSLVAADLSRYADIRVIVPGPLRNRQFSGTLVIGNGKAAIRDLSQLMGLELSRSADGYRLDEQR